MIIYKVRWVAKPGRSDVLVQLAKKGAAFAPFTVPYRISLPYHPYYGKFDEILMEYEFKDIAEFDRFWAGLFEKTPQEFWVSVDEARQSGGEVEFWRVTQ